MTSFDDLPRPAATGTHTIGESLDRFSVEEVRARIALLHAEIVRLEAAAKAKSTSREAADAIFKR